MRGLVMLLAVVTLVGCMHRTSSPFRSVRQRFAAVIHSGAIKVDANAAVAAASQPPPAPAEPAPRAEPARDRPPPRTQPAAELPVHRTAAARPTVFVLRGQTQAGAGVCEPFATSDACTSACTAKLRPNMLAAPGPTSLTSCACLEQDSGC
jgi:hypothetical protein